MSSDMPYVWRRAVLSRTRLSDSQFIGDLLAVICECHLDPVPHSVSTRLKLGFSLNSNVRFGFEKRNSSTSDYTRSFSRTFGTWLSRFLSIWIFLTRLRWNSTLEVTG
jgi:hypothetical protein